MIPRLLLGHLSSGRDNGDLFPVHASLLHRTQNEKKKSFRRRLRSILNGCLGAVQTIGAHHLLLLN